MSKPNAKDPTPSGPAAESGTPSTTTAPAASGDAGTGVAVVQSAPAGADAQTPTLAPGPDEFHGHGGLYTVIEGQRVRVARTEPATSEDPK